MAVDYDETTGKRLPQLIKYLMRAFRPHQQLTFLATITWVGRQRVQGAGAEDCQ